jgi:acyl CoA:acetate/3-ketoacid CoA transferase alpha subunit
MLGVISRARSVIDTITVDIRAGGTRLPGQSQSSGVGVLGKQSGNDQQRRGEPSVWEKPCKTMEVIVNAVVLSTDRAYGGIRHAKKTYFTRPPRPQSK